MLIQSTLRSRLQVVKIPQCIAHWESRLPMYSGCHFLTKNYSRNAGQDGTDGSSVGIPPVSPKRKTSELRSKPFLGREKPSKFCSKPFLGGENSWNFVPNHFSEEKNPWNSIPNHFSEEKNPQNSVPNHFRMRVETPQSIHHRGVILDTGESFTIIKEHKRSLKSTPWCIHHW
jgi:hypothetical protein